MLATIILGAIGVVLLVFAILDFLGGRGYTGMKLLGFSLWCMGGCFDPVNALWLAIPWTFSFVVQSPGKARFFFLFWGVGALLVIIGWMGDGYLDQPPKHP